MIKLCGIYTNRDTKHPSYWDIVYEWEDELAKALNIPLVPIGEKYDQIYTPSIFRKILNRLNFYQIKDRLLFNPTEYFVAFHIGPPGTYSFHSRKDVIPIIIDFWKNENLKRFQSIFSLNKLVLVTSREVYSYLIHKKIKINLGHLALSLPDKILSKNTNKKKEFDIIQVGRQNDTLSQYVKLLLHDFPNIDYVSGEKMDGRIQMVSSKRGALGEFTSRDSFLNLLKQTKISLVSAPGLDNDSKRTGGFSPVTPRFLESAACGCRLVGVYPLNEDFTYYSMDRICVNVKKYEEFRDHILGYLNESITPDYSDYLSNHLTSVRSNELTEKLFTLYAK